ncbi:TetR/AcrR family transcriptional regulator [Amycolatopsis jejuensis]|uniref:TetR/AcrR family transcriptional regulator n=1 Tax=Amycolatopsis jejuensis TaxID=330084 RepID=UPI0005241EEF|nr:TetR/AcrR family transcriptional regulator [Amycolatopsis jejuensis]
MGSPAAERGREVRQRLLAAAVELVPERGWAAVSTRVLADRAGVTPSVVHYHFPSLPALLREAVTGAMRQALEAAGPALEEARTPGAVVDAMLGSVAPYPGEDPLSLLFVEAYLAATRDEELREQLAGLLTDFRTRLSHWLAERGVAEPDATAEVLAATVDGLLLHRGLVPGGDLAAVLRRLVTEGGKR